MPGAGLAGSENEEGLPAGAELLRAPPTRSIGLNSTGVFVVSVLVQVVGVIATIVLYRLLPPHFAGIGLPASACAPLGPVYGHAFSLLAAAALFLLIAASVNQLADLRMGTAYIYFIARGHPARQLSGTFIALRFALIATGSLIVLAIAPMFLNLHAWNPNCGVGDVYVPFVVFMALPSLMTISTFYNQYYVGVGQSIRAQYPMLVESLFRTGALILAALFFPNIWGLTVAYAVGVVASATFCAPTLIRMLGPPLWAEVRRLFDYAAPLMGGLVLQYIVANITPFLLLGLLGATLGQTSIAVFGPVNGFRILLLAIPLAIAVPLFPNLSALHAKGSIDAIRRRTWRALRYTAMLLIPGTVALVVYRVTFLNIFFNAAIVSSGQLPLALLAVSAFAYGLAQVMTVALNAVGRQKLELYLSALQAAILLGASVVLIPLYQLTGSAIAILLASVAALALNAAYTERYIGIRVQLRPILTIFGSAAATFLVLSRINSLVSIRNSAALIAFVLIGFVVYALVLAAVGELSQQDVRILSSSIGLPDRVGRALARLCWRKEAGGVLESIPRPAPPPPPNGG